MFRITSLAAAAAVVALSSAAFAAPASATTINEGLVYSVDSRVSYSISRHDVSVWKDLSGFQQDATLVGDGISYGKKNRVVKFAGGDYSGGYEFSLDRHNFEHGFTVEARVDLGRKADWWERVFDFGNGAEDGNIVLARYEDSNELVLAIWDGDYLAGQLITTNGPLRRNAGLQTFTVRVDVNNFPELFIDGVPQMEYDVSSDLFDFYTAPPSIARTSSLIGLSNWQGDAPAEGSIQYIRLYNTRLDDDVVYEHGTTNSKWDSLG